MDIDLPPIDDQVVDRNGFFLTSIKDWLRDLYNFLTSYLGDSAIKYPPITTAERDDLIPDGGWVIFNSDIGKLQYYDGVTWQTI